LLSKSLAYYDLSKPKHYRKVLLIYKQAEKAVSECPPEDYIIRDVKSIVSLEEVKESGFITRAQINHILRVIESVERGKEIREKKPRSSRIKQAL
jgi:hypothetical protein